MSTFATATVEHVVGMVILYGLLRREFVEGMLGGAKGAALSSSHRIRPNSTWLPRGTSTAWSRSGSTSTQAAPRGKRSPPRCRAPCRARVLGPEARAKTWPADVVRPLDHARRPARAARRRRRGRRSEYLRAITSAPCEALYGSPGWCEANRVTGELVRSLARRIMGGGGDITDEESALLLDSRRCRPRSRGPRRLLASFGLRWAQAQSYRWVSSLTPDEEALLRGAYDGDPVRVRELLAKGVRTDVTHRPGMFETPGPPGGDPARACDSPRRPRGRDRAPRQRHRRVGRERSPPGRPRGPVSPEPES